MKEADERAIEEITKDRDIGDITAMYYKLEEIILDRVSELPNYEKECDCGNPSGFVVQEDEYQMTKLCLNCGGDIGW